MKKNYIGLLAAFTLLSTSIRGNTKSKSSVNIK